VPALAVPALGVADAEAPRTRFVPELADDRAWPVIKLASLFGLAALFVCIAIARLLLVSPEPRGADSTDQSSPADAAPPGGLPAQPDGQAPPAAIRAAVYPHPPSFTGQVPAFESITASERATGAAASLESIARRLESGASPPDVLVQEWNEWIEIMARGWVLLDRSSRAAADRGMIAALDAAAPTPTLSDRMLLAFAPPGYLDRRISDGRLRLSRPIDVVRGAWLSGTLAMLAAQGELPPVVTVQARHQLQPVLGATTVDPASPFTAAAAAWLDQALPAVVEMTDIDDRAYDYWALWIQAQRSLDGDERFNAALFAAVRALLETSHDLARPGRPVNVLGGLLSRLDFAASAAVRQGTADLFADQQRITTSDLWVLSSLLAVYDHAPWLGDDLIIAPDASWQQRSRVAYRMQASWPSAASTPPQAESSPAEGRVVDRAAGRQWRDRVDQVLEPGPAESAADLLAQLVTAARLSECAAYLAAGDAATAADLLAAVGSAGSAAPGPAAGAPAAPSPSAPRISLPPRRSTVRPGQPIGPDGQWAAAYRAAAGNTQQRLDLLSALGSQSGTDLGPMDAELFVHEALRGAPGEVRAVAQSIAAQNFASGPIVVMQVLDQLPDSPRTDDLGDLVAQLTGAALPDARSASWPAEARLALVDHALALRRAGDPMLEDLSAALSRAIAGQCAAIENGRIVTIVPRSPQEAEQRLVAAWREYAARLPSPGAATSDLPILHRRHITRLSLADGPLQQFVAWQVALLDLSAAVTMVEAPSARDQVQSIARRSADRRRELPRALEQAVEVELAILRLWRVRLVIPREPAA
jgi:hypothetical protein